MHKLHSCSCKIDLLHNLIVLHICEWIGTAKQNGGYMFATVLWAPLEEMQATNVQKVKAKRC